MGNRRAIIGIGRRNTLEEEGKQSVLLGRLWDFSPRGPAMNCRLECLCILDYRTKIIGGPGET